MKEVNSVAIVGASPIEGKIGNVVLKNVIRSGFKGGIYPVNPKYSEVMGLKSWPRVGDLPKAPDVVVIAVPPKAVHGVLAESISVGAKLAVIITSGFREVGNVGLEEGLKRLVMGGGIRVIGPNSAGITLMGLGLHASIEVLPKRGPIGLIMQSGALGGVVIDRLRKLSSGISFFLSLGNMLDVDVNDAMEYALHDGETRAVIAYIEWLRDGRGFIRSALNLNAKKPLCVLKGGWGLRSSEAVRSHTGGLATSYEVFKAAIRKVGAYLAEGIDDLVEVCEGLRRIKPIKGRRVLIVTNSGGLGVITASHLESMDLDLPRPSTALQQELRESAGKAFTGSNPVDFGGDASIDQVVEALKSRRIASEYNLAILAYVPTAAEPPEKLCEAMKLLEGCGVPLIAYFDGEGREEVVQHVSRYVVTVTSSITAGRLIKALYSRARLLSLEGGARALH